MNALACAAFIAQLSANPMALDIDEMGNVLHPARQYRCAARIETCAPDKFSPVRLAQQENPYGITTYR